MPKRGRSGVAGGGVRGWWLAGGVVLLAVVALVHGWSLADGTVLDDHWHQKGLREHGWSVDGLLQTLVIAPADFLGMWWQDQSVRWEYARPLFILVMKAVYSFAGGATGLHALSVLLHFASVLMVWRLSWEVTRSPGWSWVAGLVFAIYPHSVVTVAWPSSQNVVLQTALALGVVLLYVRGAGLDLTAWRETRAASTAVERPGALAGSFVLWVLALLTRENALLLPVFLAALEVMSGGGRQLRRRWGIYLAFVLTGGAFVAWRLWRIDHPMPAVYTQLPAGDLGGYLAWASGRLLHYLASTLWLAPMTIGPTGRRNPWVEVPGDMGLMLALVVVIGGVYILLTRRARGWWLWPTWILLSLAPVIPVVATPHSGYLPGVGYAVGFGLAASWFGRRERVAVRRIGHGLVTVSVLGMLVMCMFSRWQWTAIIAAEKYVPQCVVDDPPADEVEDMYFVNLPFTNIYLKPNLVARFGAEAEQWRVHALTFSPDAFEVTQRTVVRQVDGHSFEVEIMGQPYFSRMLGRFLLEGFRQSGTLRAGEIVEADGFAVTVGSVSRRGVQRLRFTFERPLNDSRAAFYLCSRALGAVRLRFGAGPVAELLGPRQGSIVVDPVALHAAGGRLAAGEAAAAGVLFDALWAEDTAARQVAEQNLRPIATFVVEALGGPKPLGFGRPSMTMRDWSVVEAWWWGRVDDEVLGATWRRRAAYAGLRKAMEEVPHARMWAGMVVESDLYLTGPAFPGPDFEVDE